VTGPLMGLGLAWFILPYCEAAFAEMESPQSSQVAQPV